MSTIKSSAEDLTLNADGSGNDVIIQSDGSTKAIITAEGNVGIGTDSPTEGNLVVRNDSGNAAINIKINDFDGSHYAASLDFSTGGQADNDPQAQIKAVGADNYSANLIFSTQLSGTTHPLAERIRIDGATGNVTVSTGNLVIGTAGKGIDFSATSDANGMTSELLDDYEEGTWTPGMTGYSGTINVQVGTYVIIGGMCYFNIQLGFSGSDTTGANITLPVISKNSGTPTGGGYMTYNTYVSGQSSLEHMLGYVGSNSSQMSVFVNDNQYQTYNGMGAAGGQCYYYFTGQYQV